MNWETVIGLEVHVQLSTASKIFSGASTTFGADPNTQACAIDMALPGVLPVLNREAIRKAVAFGLGVGAVINTRSVFDRKNYFYPDLPKGYQITQMDHPIVGPGMLEVEVDGALKQFRLTRAHLEEDAGKSEHEVYHGQSGIDLNRAGTPLLEIVTEPDMRSAAEAVAVLRHLHGLVRYLGVSDGNMEEGSFRCDVNISLRPQGSSEFGTRSEIKNINSFRFVERAIAYEFHRHRQVLEDGGRLTQETRLYDPDNDETRSMRSKEFANDYRYFPEPDLLPVIINQAFIDEVQAQLPELPGLRTRRYVESLGLTETDAAALVSNRTSADYFDAVLAVCGDARLAANWVRGEFAAALNSNDMAVSEAPVSAGMLGSLLTRVIDNTISGKIAKTVFQAMWDSGDNADTVIAREGLKQVTDGGAIESMAQAVVADNPEQVAQYRQGKQKVFGFFVGQVMKASKGKANPAQVNDILRRLLDGDT